MGRDGCPLPCSASQSSGFQLLMLEKYYGVFSHPLMLADKTQGSSKQPKGQKLMGTVLLLLQGTFCSHRTLGHAIL